MVVYFLLALIERENMCHVRSTWADFTITFLCKSWAENWLLQNIFASSIFQKVSQTFLIAAKKLIHWSALFSNCIYGLHLALHTVWYVKSSQVDFYDSPSLGTIFKSLTKIIRKIVIVFFFDRHGPVVYRGCWGILKLFLPRFYFRSMYITFHTRNF